VVRGKGDWKPFGAFAMQDNRIEAEALVLLNAIEFQKIILD